MFSDYQFRELSVIDNLPTLKMTPKFQLQNVVILTLLNNNIITTKELGLYFPNLLILAIKEPLLLEIDVQDIAPFSLENIDLQC